MRLAAHCLALGLHDAATKAGADLSMFEGVMPSDMIEQARVANERAARRAIMSALSDATAAIDSGCTQHRAAAINAALEAARGLGYDRATIYDKGARCCRVYLNTQHTVTKREALQHGVGAGSYATKDFVSLAGRGVCENVPRGHRERITGAYEGTIHALVNQDRDAALPSWWREYLAPFGTRG